MIYKTYMVVKFMKETSVKLIFEPILEVRTSDSKNVKQWMANFRKSQPC